MVRNSDIIIILKWYKDIVNDLIDILDPELPDWARVIAKRFYNAFISESSLIDLLETDCLDKNLLDKLSRLLRKTKNL